MRLRTSPLLISGLALLAGINGWLIIAVSEPATSNDHTTAETHEWTPKLPGLDFGAKAVTAADQSYRDILVHPIFSKSRAPYVPPPPPAPKITPRPLSSSPILGSCLGV